MARKKTETIIENLTVQTVAAEGKCVAHTGEGQVVFIEYAVPGDVVDVRVIKKKKNYLEARVVRIVSPSPDRFTSAAFSPRTANSTAALSGAPDP